MADETQPEAAAVSSMATLGALTENSDATTAAEPSAATVEPKIDKLGRSYATGAAKMPRLAYGLSVAQAR